jgi:hypothetical protein
VRGQRHPPGRSLPPGKTRCPLYRRLGGPQGRSGQVRKISPPTGVGFPDRPSRSQSLCRLRYSQYVGRKVYCKDNLYWPQEIDHIGVSSALQGVLLMFRFTFQRADLSSRGVTPSVACLRVIEEPRRGGQGSLRLPNYEIK